MAGKCSLWVPFIILFYIYLFNLNIVNVLVPHKSLK